MTDLPFMSFEIREKVKHHNDGQSFTNLASLELQPIVKVYETEKETEVSGFLVLNGEFQKGKDWEKQFDNSDGIHYGSFFTEENEIETFQYQIPLSIQIQNDRITNHADILVEVEYFDYQVLSEKEIELIAKIKLFGVHPIPEQDTPNVNHYELDEIADPENTTRTELLSHVTSEDQSKEEKQSNEDQDEETIIKDVNQNLGAEESNIKNEEDPVEQKDIKSDDSGKDLESHETEDDTVAEFDEEKGKEVIEEIEENIEGADVDDDSTAKMNIGIHDRNSRTSPDKEQVNPLYSLFNHDRANKRKNDNHNENKHHVGTDAQTTFNRDQDYLISNENTVLEEDGFEDSGYNTSENKGSETKEENTKEILYSLMQGNEERKYRIKIYLVQHEDTLDQIAEKYDLKEEDIINYNNLENKELEKGQLLYLPVKRE
ncbi:hypothetical protein BHF71_03345 [Vulcanibacillus modesticaldus]|uniref:LysM domain-containing protein n=1 Tax=Vulcanibacillus modesticaldus TaxID=337097 RepID=A0A1D2YSU0_9BACI|nr:LysM domain-containing protein [Vulcanibacillus modesticaldus]OEF98068.1 hypothetical protein BHF71_03345 [Vulcanibacillus modesticaldus]